MSSKPVASLSAAEKEQLAVSYASFVLSSQGQDVTPDSLEKVLKAANINVQNSLIKAFAKTLSNRNISEFYGAVGSAGSSASAPEPAGKEDKKKDAKPAGKKEAPPPPPPQEEEEGMDMGGLFD